MSTEEIRTETKSHASLDENDVDEALIFLKQNEAVGAEQAVEETAVIRKIDIRIIPIMFLCYFVQFIDKVLINYGNVMGLSRDLKLKGNEFSWVITAYSVAYLLFELPTSYLLHKFPIGKTLAVNVLVWGISTATTAATHNFKTLLVARIFLGLAEAGIGPCLIIITSMWYTKNEQTSRFALWYSGLGSAQLLGGVVSFAFQQINTPFASWRIMFIVLGLLTFLLGICAFIYVPDSPMSSEWLAREERIFVIKRISGNQTGIHNSHFKWTQLWEVLLDPQYWMFAAMSLGSALSSGFISSYTATVIASFGFDAKNAALLNIPTGAVILIGVFISSYAIRKASQRWIWIVILAIPGIIGGGLTSFLPKSNVAGLLIGIYFINCIVATVNIFYVWSAANIAGYTKRVMMNITLLITFALGNIISPLVFRAQDAPRYLPAKRMVMGSQAAVAVVAILLRIYYGIVNRMRDRKAAEEVGETAVLVEDTAWLNLTDKQNPRFRYSY